MNKLICSLVLGFLLSMPCFGQDYQKDTRKITAVYVIWYTSMEEVTAFCGRRVWACAKVSTDPRNINCTIMAPQPNNWEDRITLETLGHEFWHCLGARHP